MLKIDDLSLFPITNQNLSSVYGVMNYSYKRKWEKIITLKKNGQNVITCIILNRATLYYFFHFLKVKDMALCKIMHLLKTI